MKKSGGRERKRRRRPLKISTVDFAAAAAAETPSRRWPFVVCVGGALWRALAPLALLKLCWACSRLDLFCGLAVFPLCGIWARRKLHSASPAAAHGSRSPLEKSTAKVPRRFPRPRRRRLPAAAARAHGSQQQSKREGEGSTTLDTFIYRWVGRRGGASRPMFPARIVGGSSPKGSLLQF